MSRKAIITGDQASALSGFAEQLPKSADVPTPAARRSAPQSDSAKEAAFREAFASGYQAGFEHGAREAQEADFRRAQQFREEMEAALRRVDSAMDLWFQKAEHGVARLAREIARRLLTQELEAKPEAILGIVREALLRVNNSTRARIRINPFDLPALAERKDALMQACNSVHEIDLVGDDAMSRGSTIIESDGGVVDATVESKLERLLSEEAA